MGRRVTISTAILHIGAGKTGSTAIQHALSFNTKKLEEAGFIYPRILSVNRTYGWINHNQLAYALFNGRPTADLAAMSSHLDSLATTGKTIILSAEVFYMRPLESRYTNHINYIREKRDAILRTCDLLKSFDEVKIVCYVRRQDLWFESRYNQRVKTRKNVGMSFKEFLAGIQERHFAEQLDLWAEVFGQQNIIVRPYEKGQLCNGNVVDDFAKILGRLPVGCLSLAPENQSTVNPRLSRDALEFSQIIYRLDLDPRETIIWLQALWRVSKDMMLAHGEPAAWQRLIEFNERKRLLDQYTDTNQYVAKKYLGRCDGSLFYEKLDVDSEIYPGLSNIRAMEIWLRLQHHLNDSTLRRKMTIYKARKWIHQNFPVIKPLLSPFWRIYLRFSKRRRFGKKIINEQTTR